MPVQVDALTLILIKDFQRERWCQTAASEQTMEGGLSKKVPGEKVGKENWSSSTESQQAQMCSWGIKQGRKGSKQH